MERRTQRQPEGLLFFAAGLLLLLHHYFDWIVMRRLINTGYPDKHALDFILFLAPLCFGYGALRWYRGLEDGRRSRAASFGIRAVCIASVALGAAWFFAKWIYHSDIPWFVLLFYPGSLLLTAGLLLLLSASRSPAARWTLVVLAAISLAYPIAPQLIAAAQGKAAGSEWKFALGTAYGAVMAVFGGTAFLRRFRH